ncbi:MAG: AN1-type zinc finger domain-containing protein, partial [Candidatus Helarchaeota archaeon]
KIFETIISFMAQKLFDKLAEKLKFKKKEKKDVASGYIDGAYITIYYEEDKFTTIISDDKLTDEECRRIAKKIIKELYKLQGIELDINDIEINMRGFASGICHYCLIKVLTYKCRRCNGYYCSNHRLPEKHNCPGDRKIRFEIIRKEKNKKKLDKDEKSEKIIIVESHCG